MDRSKACNQRCRVFIHFRLTMKGENDEITTTCTVQQQQYNTTKWVSEEDRVYRDLTPTSEAEAERTGSKEK